MLYSRLSLVIYFIYSSVSMLVPISHLISPSPFPLGILKFALYIPVLNSVLQIGSSVLLFQDSLIAQLVMNLPAM